MANKSEKRS